MGSACSQPQAPHYPHGSKLYAGESDADQQERRRLARERKVHNHPKGSSMEVVVEEGSTESDVDNDELSLHGSNAGEQSMHSEDCLESDELEKSRNSSHNSTNLNRSKKSIDDPLYEGELDDKQQPTPSSCDQSDVFSSGNESCSSNGSSPRKKKREKVVYTISADSRGAMPIGAGVQAGAYRCSAAASATEFYVQVSKSEASVDQDIEVNETSFTLTDERRKTAVGTPEPDPDDHTTIHVMSFQDSNLEKEKERELQVITTRSNSPNDDTELTSPLDTPAGDMNHHLSAFGAQTPQHRRNTRGPPSVAETHHGGTRENSVNHSLLTSPIEEDFLQPTVGDLHF